MTNKKNKKKLEQHSNRPINARVIISHVLTVITLIPEYFAFEK